MPDSLENLAEELARHLAASYPEAELRRAAARLTGEAEQAGLERYRDDPVGYAREQLGATFIWDKMEEIARACLEPPYKIAVQGGHSIGKSWLGGWLTNWFYDTRRPGIVVTTAPKKDSVVELLWKEVRLQRARNPHLPDDFIGPAAPEMRDGPDHYAKGYVANKGESFQGRHVLNMMFLFDESVGLPGMYFETTRTMFKPEQGHVWILFYNPTDTTSAAYQEVTAPGSDWRVFSLSSLDHPNISLQLAGEPPVVPSAVTLAQVDEWVQKWCVPIREDEREKTDIQWRGRWYRPAAEFEARCLGRWPSRGSYSVWGEYLWDRCCFRGEGENDIRDVPMERLLASWLGTLPEIGCDVARFGDDKTAFHVRWGCYSLFHESVSGFATTETTGRLIELAREYADLVNDLRRREGGRRPDAQPEEIKIKIDDDGVGGACVDRLREQGYAVVGVGAGSAAHNPKRYPNRRSELWFSTVEQANDANGDGVWLGLLDDKTLAELKRQAMAPRWKLDSAGRRVVEPKDVTKEKIGRSPDDLDAMNLAWYEAGWEPPTVVDAPRRPGVASAAAGGREREREEAGGDRMERPRRDVFGRW